MKNRLFLSWACLALCFLFSGNLFSQCGSSAFEILAANKVKAGVLNVGDLFRDPNATPPLNDASSLFSVPYIPGEEEINSLFLSGLWLGGLGQDSSLMTACQNYGGFSGRLDFRSGPINDSTGQVINNGCENFDKVWKVNRGDILQVIEDFSDNGLIDFPLPENIKKWPARGNQFFENEMGFPLPDQNLAPFFDANNNGIYEPLNGEYPVIENDMPFVIPDEMTWCVFNDIQGEHLETGGQPLGVEIQLTAYAFNCDEDEILNHTIFTKYKIIKKAGEDLMEFRAGLFHDSNLGCWSDDFFGCDTLKNTLYYYNATQDDSFTFCSEEESYGTNPPVQAMTILNQKMAHLSMYRGNLFCDPPVGQVWPSNALDYYNLLSGKWRDGTPLTYGESGYNDTSTQFVNHLYFDNPNGNTPNNWSLNNLISSWVAPECNLRAVMSIEPNSLNIGDVASLDFAYSFHRHPDSTNLGNVNVALENIPHIQDLFDNNFSGVCTQFEYCMDDCIWPGDANVDGIAKEDDILYLGIGISQSGEGTSRTPASPIWAPHISENWDNVFFDGTNFKHADFNGDGLISTLDDDILRENFYLNKPDYIEVEKIEAPIVPNGLYIKIQRDEIFTWKSEILRSTVVEARISQNENLPPLSGISFVLKYDTTFFDIADWTSNNFYFNNTNALGSVNEIMHTYELKPERGEVAFGVAREDGDAITNLGDYIFSIWLEAPADAPITSPDSIEVIKMKLLDAFGATADGEIIPLGYESDSVFITNLEELPSSVSDFFNSNLNLEISPNPNNGQFSIFSKNNSGNISLELFNLNGQKIWSGKMNSGQEKIEINLSEHISSGIYFLKVMSNSGGFYSQKIIIE